MTALEANLDSFSFFIFLLKVCGVYKNNENWIEKIFSTIPIFLQFLLFLPSLITRRVSSFKESIVVYCQGIEGSSNIACTLVIFCGVFFSHQPQRKIIEMLSKIDDSIQDNMKMKIDYKRVKIVNNFIASICLIHLIIFYVFVYSIATQVLFFAIFAISVFSINIIEFFYIVLVIQIRTRIFKFEVILRNFHQNKKWEILEIFQRVYDTIDVVNSSLGLSILMIFIKHFVRITTRVFIIYYIISYYNGEVYRDFPGACKN